MNQVVGTLCLLKEEMLNQQVVQPTSQEWVGLYMNQRDVVPKWVVKGGYIKDFNFGPVQFSVNFMGIFSKSTVRLQ